ncbi:MAG TPA: efflux transporter outer membrane subunit [Terriglobales bacterium]|jgi:NodT family efflux transporter outer membrane factor (OMF) lipoprotein|nr:efflux transporter outer membrane subunit [Terriglobales bacterium]
MNSRRDKRPGIQIRNLSLGSICIATAILFSGCAVGPKYQRPPVDVPPAYKEVGNWKAAEPSEQKLGGNWWEIFQDPQLNALEEQVNVSNQNLKIAQAQYTQARALLRYNRADYFPTITAAPSVTRGRVSSNRPAQSAISNGKTTTDIQLPLELSYEIDAWGRVRNNVASFRAEAQASAADLATVNLSMHAQLALFYFQARSLDAQEQLLNSTVAQYEQALRLNEDRFRGGVGSEVEVEQARTQLETTRAQAIDVGVLRAQFEHAVAILIGKPPASFSLPPLPLRTPPPAIPAGMPSELLERRPDIASAERLVAAANARIGVAKAAYYPLLNLVAAGGFESGSITTLLSGPSALWAVGPSALYTIFDGGRRHAASDQAIAAHDQTVASYRETVLTSFQQVEDNLAALRILEKEAETQHVAVVAAQKSLDLSVQRYNGGVTSYLEVTVAQSAALADEVTAVNILGRRMVAAVQLVQALGGGWDSSSLPQRPECCGKLVGQEHQQAIGKKASS